MFGSARRFLARPRAQLPTLLLCTALGTVLVWQVRVPFVLDVGSPNDDPYLAGWHGAETARDSALTYRWSQARSELLIPAYGATAAALTLRMREPPEGGVPTPPIEIDFGAGPRRAQLRAEVRAYEFHVPAAAFRDGSLRVRITSQTFRPPTDNRDLGVLLDSVRLTDAGAPHGLVLPPLGVTLTILLLSLLAYTVFGYASTSTGVAAVAGWTVSAAMLFFAYQSRFELGLFVPALAAVTSATAAGTALATYVARSLRRRFAWQASARAIGLAVLVAGLQFLALLLGMRHPQFRSSDLMLNVHRLEFVEQGHWIFSLPLPGPRPVLAPYPPAYYAVMLPFSPFVDAALLVEVVAALFTVIGVLLAFALARRLTQGDGAALWAAGAFTLAPVSYEMASSGNFANLYAQGVANIYLASLIFTVGRWTRPWTWLILTLLLTVALAGHFGVFLSLVALGPLLIVATWVASSPGARGPRATALALSYLGALAAVYALYYRFHVPLFEQYFRLLSERLQGAAGPGEPRLPFQRRLLYEWRGALAAWGGPGLAAGLVGAGLLARGERSAERALSLSWLGSALLFAGIAVAVGLSVRYSLFVLPPFAAAVGLAFWRLQKAHRIGGPLAMAVLASVWLWQSGAFWIARVLHEYH